MQSCTNVKETKRTRIRTYINKEKNKERRDMKRKEGGKERRDMQRVYNQTRGTHISRVSAKEVMNEMPDSWRHTLGQPWQLGFLVIKGV